MYCPHETTCKDGKSHKTPNACSAERGKLLDTAATVSWLMAVADWEMNLYWEMSLLGWHSYIEVIF